MTNFAPIFPTIPGSGPSTTVPVTEEGIGPAQNVWPPNPTTGGGGGGGGGGTLTPAGGQVGVTGPEASNSIAPVGSNGQVLTVVGGSAQWAAASGGALAGEVTGPAGNNVASGPFATASLNWKAAVVAPVWSQLIAVAGAGQPMSYISQAAAVGSGLNGGNLNIGTGAGDGGGVPGIVQVEFGGVVKDSFDEAFGVITAGEVSTNTSALLGPSTGFETTWASLWLLPVGTTRLATNYAIKGGDGDLYINAFLANGFLRFVFANNTFHLATAKGLQINDNVPDFGAGDGVIGMTPSNVAPTTNPGGMVLYVDPADGSTKIRGSLGDITIIAIA